MFTDIVGSTERAADLGDKRWRQLLAAHQEAVRQSLTASMVARSRPSATAAWRHSMDRPGRSAAASRSREAPHLDLEVRIGLHCGEVELVDEDVGGIAVHIAARIGALAGPGEVLVSSTVKDLVAGSGIEFADRGAQSLKGVADEWRLYAAGA